MIRLFTTYYSEKIQDRREEYLKCFDLNFSNPLISEVCVLDESQDEVPFVSPKLLRRPIHGRPKYLDFFNWVNEVATETDFSIIANTDIVFDPSIEIIKFFEWTPKTCLALSRWDVCPNDHLKLFEHGDSQDVWIFKGKIDGVNGNFPLGVYDCDNKIAWELEQAGYRVINPCYAVRTFHHHQCGYRSYEVKPPPDYGIRPPFRYVEPDNYWGPLEAFRIQRQLKLNYFPWMLTQNRFWRYPIPKFTLRIWNKAMRSFRPKAS